MYLLDSNICLELFLEQERADEVEQLLRSYTPKTFSLTEFSLYSICLNLVNRKKMDALESFMKDIQGQNGIPIIRLPVNEFDKIVKNINRFRLDFDDAYQYTVAENYNLQIVSFDTDFDKTERGHVTPQQILDMLKKKQQ